MRSSNRWKRFGRGDGAWKSVIRLAALASLLTMGNGVIQARRGLGPEATCTRLVGDDIRWGDEIVLLSNDATMTTSLIERAIARWQRCDQYASGFPRFVVGEGRGPRVEIHFEKHTPGPGYCGLFAGGVITLHHLARVGDRIVPCPRLDRVLAHELGHVLGLRDVAKGMRCPTFIMSEIVEAGPPLQTVSRAECGAVARRWMTSRERGDGTRPGRRAAAAVVP
jgi:hypothetical protein